MAKGRTAEVYAKNPKSAAKRSAQQRAYNKTAKGMQIRTAANKLNRKLGTYGNGDNKDGADIDGNARCRYLVNSTISSSKIPTDYDKPLII